MEPSPDSKLNSWSNRSGAESMLVHFTVLHMSEASFLPRLDALLSSSRVPLELRHAFLPAASRAIHRTKAASLMRRHYTRETAKLALDLYKDDYAAFGMRMPGVDKFSL